MVIFRSHGPAGHCCARAEHVCYYLGHSNTTNPLFKRVALVGSEKLAAITQGIP